MSFYEKRTVLPPSTFKMLQDRLPVLLKVLENRRRIIERMEGVYIKPSAASRLKCRYNALIKSVEKLQTLSKGEV